MHHKVFELAEMIRLLLFTAHGIKKLMNVNVHVWWHIAQSLANIVK